MSLQATLRRLGRRARDLSLRYVRPAAPGVHYFFFFKLRRFLARSNVVFSNRGALSLRAVSPSLSLHKGSHQPLVSIVVPAYNHEKYLDQRLETIFGQSYSNIEVILLDDGSSDDSADVLRKWALRYPQCSRLSVNDVNSGSPFRQWAKGLELATGDLIWIAESDDFSSPTFLEKIVPAFANPAVNLAFGFTEFTDEAGCPGSWGLRDYLPELGPDFWDQDCVNTAHNFVRLIWSRRNLIPNVSGLVFRPRSALSLFNNPQWNSMRVCGDWWFYLYLARGGMVAYCSEAINFYRQHPSNTSVSEHKSQRYVDEHLVLAEQTLGMYSLDDNDCHALREELKDRCAAHMGRSLPAEVTERIEAIRPYPAFEGRQPNILLVTYALIVGGGEILPLKLANMLSAQGYSVTVLDCAQLPEQEGVRSLLNPGIPLITLEDLRDLPGLVRDFGIELVHSHNTWVDRELSETLQGEQSIAHVITSHGMYDTIDDEQIKNLGATLKPWLCGVAYVADKNRAALLRMGYDEPQLQHLPNALDSEPVVPISRESLQIPEDALLLCLASRAIREKGWQEAIQAVDEARQRSGSDIRLMILGEGPEKRRLDSEQAPQWLYFLGFCANVRAYFATADLGLLSPM